MTVAELEESRIARALTPGVRYMLGAAFFFSLMSLCVKLAGERLPSMQIVLARYVVMLALTQWMVWRARISVAGGDRPALVGRSITGFVALSLFYYAVVELPLGDVTTIHFMSPLFTALIAAYFLKERSGRFVWLGGALSLSGVLLIAQPSFLFGENGLPKLAVMAAIGGAVLSAAAYTFVRKLRKTDHHLVVIYWFCALGVLFTIPFALPVALWPTPAEWMLLLGVGVATQIAQIFLTKGLHLEAAGKASSVGYVQIIFAFFWGMVFFGHMPTLWTLAGVLIIVGGVMLVVRQKG
jgi:drug/metabolite transporter (DMT)-like permease